MSSETRAAPGAPSGSEATEAGNIFVSNYPPFSCWTGERLAEARAALDRPPKPGAKLGVYAHIPFCRKRCHFCYFKVYTDKNSLEIKGYLDGLLRELELYAGKPFVGGRRPDFVYFGGGTPSYLGSDQLLYLTDGMKRLLPWDAAEEVAFECEPGTLTEHKLKIIRELGVTRLSLGVEHFDDHVLEINGRAHRSKEIGRAYGYARELDFPQINIDLIAGMVEETEERWQDAVEKAVALAPDSVTIYQMEIPFNTTIYQRMKADGKLTAPVADWPTKRRWVAEAFARFEAAGYTVASAYTVVKNPKRTRFCYRDYLWTGADLIGGGVASFGHIGGTHLQNLASFEAYAEALQRGELPLWRALTPTPEERFIREWILQLKLGRVRATYFRDKFGVDPRERFAAELEDLRDRGFAKVEGDEIGLSREGLLQVDRLLHGFFLPQHRNIRYT
ncbi:MAG: coproporphyrinogen III oxidase family protein [Planctomycetota bacterium]|nr:coproporphyrinogen III oxidase family protein [Planctomycetota bacterium]